MNSKRTILIAAAMFGLLGWPAPGISQIYQTPHDCDAPVQEQSIHEAHGELHCGNIDTSGEGHPEICTQEIKSGGQIQRGEWLACGEHSGPGGGIGCSWDVIERCGGQLRSGNVSVGLSYNGAYPQCHIEAVLGQTAPAYVCTWRSSGTVTNFHACFCDTTAGEWTCI